MSGERVQGSNLAENVGGFCGFFFVLFCFVFCSVVVFGQSTSLNWPAGQVPVLVLGRRRPGHDVGETETSDLLWNWSLNDRSLRFLE